MSQQVFAFAKVDDADARDKVYQEIKNGKSRFGMWNQEVSLKDDYYGMNDFLLRIQVGDWIVHVNSPNYGHCVAVQASGEYDFDEGFECSWGVDFRNYIPVDPSTIVEFERTDPNVVPSVNLAPMRRGQRILQVEDFLRTIDNLRDSKHSDKPDELRGLIHLKERFVEEMLPRLTELIQKMNRSKEFEKFLQKIFENMPNVISTPNGFGWGTDYGADLIVEFRSPLKELSLTSKMVVQAKSYEGEHQETNAVDQLVVAMDKFRADCGLLITTARKTEALEDRLLEASEKTGKAIDLIAGDDVARFVIRYAPEMLIGLE